MDKLSAHSSNDATTHQSIILWSPIHNTLTKEEEKYRYISPSYTHTHTASQSINFLSQTLFHQKFWCSVKLLSSNCVTSVACRRRRYHWKTISSVRTSFEPPQLAAAAAAAVAVTARHCQLPARLLLRSLLPSFIIRILIKRCRAQWVNEWSRRPGAQRID